MTLALFYVCFCAVSMGKLVARNNQLTQKLCLFYELQCHNHQTFLAYIKRLSRINLFSKVCGSFEQVTLTFLLAMNAITVKFHYVSYGGPTVYLKLRGS